MKTQKVVRDTRWRMLSQTAQYAVSVVLYLAADRHRGPVSASQAAAELAIPERYLGRVLNELTRHGVLTSTRGAQGGFELAVAPSRLTLAAVVAPFDAVGESPQCLVRPQLCAADEPCLAHHQWHDVALQVRSFFQTTRIADFMNKTVDLHALTVNETVRLWPATVDVFNRFGIDACCGGASRLVEAAERHGADAAAMLDELRRVIGEAV